MKLIIFLLVILIIYLIVTNVKVVHSDTFSATEKKILDDRDKVRSMLLYNHIPCSKVDQKNQTNQTPQNKLLENYQSLSHTDSFSDSNNDDLPTGLELVKLITNEYYQPKYLFNIATKPVTTRYPNPYNQRKDKKYLKYIKENIRDWNDLLPTNKKLIKIVGVKLIFVKETENEFVVDANVKLLYQNQTIHLNVSYYGNIEYSDDFLNEVASTCYLQLVRLKIISPIEYDSTKIRENVSPFISMEEQLAYVEKIKQMHLNEN